MKKQKFLIKRIVASILTTSIIMSNTTMTIFGDYADYVEVISESELIETEEIEEYENLQYENYIYNQEYSYETRHYSNEEALEIKEYEIMDTNSYSEDGILYLRFVGSYNPYHLSLDPANNTRQTHRMELMFSPGGNNTYAPGEIELRLPFALFKDRAGNYITTPRPMDIPFPGESSFNYVIIGNEVVITNFETVIGSDIHMRAYFDFSFTPSQSANGFTNEFYALASFGGVHGREPFISNEISFNLTTRVVPSEEVINKMAMQNYSSWNPAWGG